MMHLAQVNVSRARTSLHHPAMTDFLAAIDAINRLAEEAPGFVWRYQDPAGDVNTRVFGDARLVVNLSVWESPDTLRAYTYQSGHVAVMRRRREWFDRLDAPHLAMWWLPEGETPTPEAGRDRLAHLASHGPTPEAFTFTPLFDPPTS